MKKLTWNEYAKSRQCGQYVPQKGTSCDRLRANACSRRAAFAGTDRIGPRYYYFYRCPVHGSTRIRLEQVEHKHRSHYGLK